MKKIILLLLVCSSTYTLYAQDASDTMQNKKTKMKMKSKGNPNDMQNGTISSSTTTTNTTIVVMTGWRTDPASLPVIGTDVSADVVTNIKNKYGATVYDIRQMKSSSGQDIYAVRVMDNGQIRTDYVGADGNVIAK